MLDRGTTKSPGASPGATWAALVSWPMGSRVLSCRAPSITHVQNYSGFKVLTPRAGLIMPLGTTFQHPAVHNVGTELDRASLTPGVRQRRPRQHANTIPSGPASRGAPCAVATLSSGGLGPTSLAAEKVSCVSMLSAWL
jgi:hypothetical protein